ncbi:MAG: Gfo/Idh/MocA family oxidoreductase [Actinobacteria bacterium]|nr:Gfo/Idh/MocA family oxidoreductase [Actinomycetota bacterium]
MINAAVIGVGRLGPVHVMNLLRIPTKVKIVAICDLREDRANYYAKISNSKPYTDYKKMFEKEKIDVVFVITETHNHYNIVIDCVKAGKNIFCEKPIAETLEKAKKVKEVVSKAKIKFQVGYMRRFDPAYSQAYKMNQRQGTLLPHLNGLVTQKWEVAYIWICIPMILILPDGL